MPPQRASETVKVTPEVKEKLDKAKEHKRETYNDVISRLLEENNED